MDIGKEDMALGLFVVVVLVTVAVFNSGGNKGNGYEPTDFCLEVVANAETNLSTMYTNVECECISPEPYRNDKSTPAKVRNATYIRDVVKCSAKELEEDLIFPILTVNESRINSSKLNSTQIGTGSAGIMR